MKFSKNPVPGMNPWLEAYWGDVHTSLTTYARDAIQKQLPNDLQARVEEYLAVVDPDDDVASRRMSPDVQVFQQPGLTKTTAPRALDDLRADQPIVVRRRSEPQTLRYIQIVDLKNHRRVVTAIEFLSLANKATRAGRQQCLSKQAHFLEAEVNLVEIDLIRDGAWVLAAQRENYPQRLLYPYRICVVRGQDTETAELYAATYRSALPTIRIPLRPSDDDVLLPLQQLLDQSYENGRYGNDLDYSVQPDPPLDESDFEWITSILRG